MDESDNWPLSDYNPGPRSHLHALGVIAVTFAALETSVGGLFFSVARRKNADATPPNFLSLPEKKKVKAIKSFFAEHHTPEDVIASIDNLLDYFGWCQHCRNQLLHAERYPGFFAPKDTLYLTKRVSKMSSKFGYVKLNLQEVRDIAEKVRAGVMQCAELGLYLRFENAPRQKIPVDYLRYTEALPSMLTVPQPLKLALWPEPDD